MWARFSASRGVAGLGDPPLDGRGVVGAALLGQVVGEPVGGLGGRRAVVVVSPADSSASRMLCSRLAGPDDAAGPDGPFVGVGDVRGLDPEGERRQVGAARGCSSAGRAAAASRRRGRSSRTARRGRPRRRRASHQGGERVGRAGLVDVDQAERRRRRCRSARATSGSSASRTSASLWVSSLASSRDISGSSRISAASDLADRLFEGASGRAAATARSRRPRRW